MNKHCELANYYINSHYKGCDEHEHIIL